MNQFIFRNRWFAAGFVALILLGAYLLVGDRESGPLARVTNGVADRRQELNTQMAQAAAPAPLPPPAVPEAAGEEHEFLDDEDLIDTAAGMDPTPPDEMAQGDDDGDIGADRPAETANTGSDQQFEFVNGVAILRQGR
ncbi:MAG TPA: hypothetical protein VL094_02090 [Sphingomonadaceae bacterium]|nr:hypothetical protein [Sphingomonadaceae bacterium]